MKIASLIITTLALGVSSAVGETPSQGNVPLEAGELKPKEGFVPTQKQAIAIASAVASAIYGDDEISKQKPFKTELKDGVWHVTGTVNEKVPGGAVLIKIKKETGEIISVSHSQ